MTLNIKQLLLHSTMIGSAALMAVVAVPAVTLLTPTAASAQDYTSGILSGTVSDSSGARVGGATVTATSGQGSVRTATTDANGSFRIPALAVGSYEVSVTSSAGSTADRITVSPGGSSYAFTVTENTGATSLGDIVVTGARKTQDFSRTDTGLSVDVQELQIAFRPVAASTRLRSSRLVPAHQMLQSLQVHVAINLWCRCRVHQRQKVFTTSTA